MDEFQFLSSENEVENFVESTSKFTKILNETEQILFNKYFVGNPNSKSYFQLRDCSQYYLEIRIGTMSGPLVGKYCKVMMDILYLKFGTNINLHIYIYAFFPINVKMT